MQENTDGRPTTETGDIRIPQLAHEVETADLESLKAITNKLLVASDYSIWALKICQRWLNERGYTMGEAHTAIGIALSMITEAVNGTAELDKG